MVSHKAKQLIYRGGYWRLRKSHVPSKAHYDTHRVGTTEKRTNLCLIHFPLTNENDRNRNNWPLMLNRNIVHKFQ